MKSRNRTGCVWCGEAMRDGEAVIVANVGALCGDCLRKWRVGGGEPVEAPADEVKHMGSTGWLLEKEAWKAEAERRSEEIAQLKAEVAGLRDTLEAAKYALGRAFGLEALGYNQRNAEDLPGQADQTGVTFGTYRNTADSIRADIREAEDKVREALGYPVRTAVGPAPSGPGGGPT